MDKVIGDISKASATKQILLGATSGWIVGSIAIKVGKITAVALGGGVLILQIANAKGYIKINWNKVNNQLDKATDIVEEKITGQQPFWTQKVERYMERKLDKAEDTLKNRQAKANQWYRKLMGNPNCKIQDIHIFLISFCAGIALGIGTS